MSYILGFIIWLLKPSNDHATLGSCIDTYKEKRNAKSKHTNLKREIE